LELPQLTPEQNWNRMEFHWATWAAVATAYAQEQGHSVESFALWLAEKVAPSWGESGSGTPARLVRGWYRNAAAWKDLEFEVLVATDEMVTVRSNRPWAQDFDAEGMYGLTADGVDQLFRVFYQNVATHLGLTFEQESEGDYLVITVQAR
jgi:hypothetical protein